MRDVVRGLKRYALAAAVVLLGGAAPASADLNSLKPTCATQDAADGTGDNGVQIPYLFCDDGVPATGGRTANPGALLAVAVPQRYDGFQGLPPKLLPPDPNSGADPNGDIALDVDVSMPDPLLFPPPPGGYPLVVMMHGCCAGDKTGWEVRAGSRIDAGGEKWHYNNGWFAARGYVVLTYTARGFVDAQNRGSTGETQLDSRRYEINDFQHLAGQLADDAFWNVDPQRVVATGGSYGGGFSWMALTDPTWTSPAGKAMQLAAAAPKYGWSDLVYSLIPNGGHRSDALPPSNGSATTTPFGFPKKSILAGLFVSGRTGIPPLVSPHATFHPSIDQAFACLQSSDPYEQNPLCTSPMQTTLPEFVSDRSPYYQNEFFDRVASDPSARVPVFSAGTFTDPLFTSIEHRRMVERLRSAFPDYPVQEDYGDYQHFVQNKAKEWGDVCGADLHVCRQSDYAGGDLNADPSGLVARGVTTRLNRLVDHHAKPQGNPTQGEPERDVRASLQVCPQNASGASPADMPGERFTASRFRDLAPNTLIVDVKGAQATTNKAAPNEHALRADPVENEVANGRRCPVANSAGGFASAGPGVATYDSEALPQDFTMIGQTRVTVPHTGQGPGVQLNARLYDLFPDGTQVMVDRGVRRVANANGTEVYDLHGNGWRFPKDHKVRIELAQDDDPYIKASNQPSFLTLEGVKLEIPVRESSAVAGGTVPPRSGAGPSPRVKTRAPKRASDRSRTRRFRVRTEPRAPTKSADIFRYEVEVQSAPRGTFRAVRRGNVRSSTFTFRGRAGKTYRFRGRAIGRNGTVGRYSSAATLVPRDDHAKGLRYRGGWSRKKVKGAYGKRLSRSTRRGARLSFRARSGKLYLIGRESRRGGRARLVIDGKPRTISFRGRRKNRHVIAAVRLRGTRTHRVRVVNLGGLVEIDAVGVLR